MPEDKKPMATSTTHPEVKKESKESRLKKAKEKTEQKQEALTKANEAAAKAHSELMAAQLEEKQVESSSEEAEK